MDRFIFLFLLLFIITIIIPGGISLFILWDLEREKLNKKLRLLALVPFLIVGFLIYTALYPLDQFYEEELEEVTGVEFPNDAEILSKWASYPDFHGDYG